MSRWPRPPRDQELLKQYLSTVGQRRAAELERDRLTAEQRQQPTPENAQKLQQALVQVATLDTQMKAAEERARRASVTLPPASRRTRSRHSLACRPRASGPVWVSAGRRSPGWLWSSVGGIGLALGRRFRRPPDGPAPAPVA